MGIVKVMLTGPASLVMFPALQYMCITKNNLRTDLCFLFVFFSAHNDIEENVPIQTKLINIEQSITGQKRE